jgi:PAS domain S-box-containing protein
MTLEEIFKEIFAESYNGVILIDPETKEFIMGNHEIHEMLGVSKEEFNVLGMSDIHPKDDMPWILLEFEKHMSGVANYAPNIPVVRKNGTIFYADIKSSFVTIDSKTYTIGIFRDITERKDLEERQMRHLQLQAILNVILELSLKPMSKHDLLEAILDIVLSVPSLALESKGCILLIEDDFEKLYMAAHRNMHPNLVKMCNIVSFGHCLCGKAAASRNVVFADCIDERHDIHYDGMIEHGHYIIPIISGSNILGVLNLYVKPGHKREEREENILISISNTIAGIIDRKDIEDKLHRYADELDRSNEEMKKFTYILSHDLRSPLVNLKGFSHELRESVNEALPLLSECQKYIDIEKYQRYKQIFEQDIPESLNFIESSSTKIAHMMDAILKLSRLGRNEFNMQDIDTEEIVILTINSLSHQIKSKGVEITCGKLPKIMADRVAMEQVFGNLIDNALKYLDHKRKNVIEITSEVKDGDNVFHVKDNGIGIAEDDYDKVFQIFKRIGLSDIQGEGMGLAYTKTIITNHGGDIWFESILGQGSTFSFSIPK